MPIPMQSIARSQANHEVNIHVDHANDNSFHASVRQIAQSLENQDAWLPNPVEYRFLNKAQQSQFSVASLFQSSSAHIEEMAIAFEVNRDRNYLSAPSSTTRLKVTMMGLGGAGDSSSGGNAASLKGFEKLYYKFNDARTAVALTKAEITGLDVYLKKDRNKARAAGETSQTGKYGKRVANYESQISSKQTKLTRQEEAMRQAEQTLSDYEALHPGVRQQYFPGSP